MPDTSIIMMAKAPIPGTVKTRLQGKLSPQQCADLYKCFLLDIADCVLKTGYKFYIFFTPKEEEGFFKAGISGANLHLQRGKNLGERMYNAITKVYKSEKNKVIVIGGDVPILQPSHLIEASEMLSARDVVLGPSLDGGYYLIGFQSPRPALFEGVSWGTSEVFSETVDRIKGLNLTYALLPELMDIDYFEDLQKLREIIFSEKLNLNYIPKRTQKWIEGNMLSLSNS